MHDQTGAFDFLVKRKAFDRFNLVVQTGLSDAQVQAVERYAFYEKIKGASLIVQTGEGTAYGNAMFCKGVILL